MQQITGINLITYYAATIYEQSIRLSPLKSKSERRLLLDLLPPLRSADHLFVVLPFLLKSFEVLAACNGTEVSTYSFLQAESVVSRSTDLKPCFLPKVLPRLLHRRLPHREGRPKKAHALRSRRTSWNDGSPHCVRSLFLSLFPPSSNLRLTFGLVSFQDDLPRRWSRRSSLRWTR